MPEELANMRDSIAEALAASEFPTEEAQAAASWDAWDAEESDPAADDGSEPSKEEVPDPEAEPEASDGTGEEPPTVYWGVNLEGIPAEQRRSIIDSLQQQDTYIKQLQERLAKPDEPVENLPPDSEPEEITDEALLQALGFDPEDWETQQLAPRLLPLARAQLALEEQVQAMVEAKAAQDAASSWESQLGELEATYGPLPGTRQQQLRMALEEGIASPFELYHRISAPARKEVEDAVVAARRAAAKKAEAGGVKPRGAANTTETPIDPKTTSLRDAVAQAMKESEKETGLSWRNVFGRKVAVEE